MTKQSDTSTLPEYLPPDEVARLIARMRESGWDGMDIKKRAFAIAYLNTYSHTKAAEEIKLKPSEGLRYIRDPLVLAMIQDLQESFIELNIITENFVRQKWIELLPKLMGEEEVQHVYKGVSFSEKKFHGPETIAVLKELGRSTQDFYKHTPLDDFADSLKQALQKD